MRYESDDAVITAYEDLWRAFALSGASQFYGEACDGRPGSSDGRIGATCAYIAGQPYDDPLMYAAMRPRGRAWQCDCGWSCQTMAEAMMHLNNRHHCGWDWFANKFREAWEAGLR